MIIKTDKKISASMMNPRVGMCSDNFYAEVVTGQHNGPVGLVEPCPGIFLAAVNVQKTSWLILLSNHDIDLFSK